MLVPRHIHPLLARLAELLSAHILVKQLISSTTNRLNPLKRSGVRWLHFEVFSVIQV